MYTTHPRFTHAQKNKALRANWCDWLIPGVLDHDWLRSGESQLVRRIPFAKNNLGFIQFHIKHFFPSSFLNSQIPNTPCMEDIYIYIHSNPLGWLKRGQWGGRYTRPVSRVWDFTEERGAMLWPSRPTVMAPHARPQGAPTSQVRSTAPESHFPPEVPLNREPGTAELLLSYTKGAAGPTFLSYTQSGGP